MSCLGRSGLSDGRAPNAATLNERARAIDGDFSQLPALNTRNRHEDTADRDSLFLTDSPFLSAGTVPNDRPTGIHGAEKYVRRK